MLENFLNTALETEMEDPEECRITVKVMLEDLFANYTKD